MFFKKITILLCCCAVVFAGAGCSKGSSKGFSGSAQAVYAGGSADFAAEKAAAAGADYRQANMSGRDAGSGVGGAAYDDGGIAYNDGGVEKNGENLGVQTQTKKLVRQATVRVQTGDLSAAEPALTEALNRYGAYAEHSELQDQYRFYTIRVPESAFQALLEDLKGFGRVLYQTESAEDVTLRYYDLVGRLGTKETLRDTFKNYLKTAKTIEEIMNVEARIADLQQELDWMGTELRNLSNLVDYGTIRFEIRLPPTAYSPDAPTLRERIAGVFGGFKDFATGALLIFIGAVIYGIPSLLILCVLYWVLFGKIGVMKKLWRIVSGKPTQR